MKKFSKQIFVILISLLLMGCYRKYDRTITVCDGKLFVERYQHNFIDVAYYYLTDSANFRIYVGKFDNEHGGYSIMCQDDLIKISEDFEGKIINVRKYSLGKLRMSKLGF